MKKSNAIESNKDDLNIIKIETIDLKRIEYKIETKMAEKRKWEHRFCKSYAGGTKPDNDGMYDDNNKFIVAVCDGKELGYIRLLNHTIFDFPHADSHLWNISCGYVKPAYRSQGILRALIESAINHHEAGSITINPARYLKFNSYYTTLGFIHPQPFIDMFRVCNQEGLNRWQHLIEQLNSNPNSNELERFE